MANSQAISGITKGSGFYAISLVSITPAPLRNTLHKSSYIIYIYLSILVAIKKEKISLCASKSPLQIFVKITFVILLIRFVSL